MKTKSWIISGVIILVTLFLFTAFSAVQEKNEREAKIALENMQVVYLGAENPVLVSVPGVDPADLIVAVEGGTIRKDSVKANRYFIKTTSLTKVQLLVAAKSAEGNKIIATENFRVKNIQDPVLYFGNHSEDCAMSRDEIRKETGLFSRMENCDFDGTFRITSFSMSVYSNGKWTESATEGPAFTDAQKSDLAGLQTGDRIIFHHIHVKGFGEITRTIPGMYVTVQ